MLKSFFVASTIVIAIAFFTGAAVSGELKEGLWEMTTKTEMKGMPANMPAMTMKQCVTKKDGVPKPQQQEKGVDCKMKDQKVSGDTMTYVMECKNKDGSTMESKVKMINKGDSFESTTNTTMTGKGEGENMQMASKMTGKYLGPCPKEKK